MRKQSPLVWFAGICLSYMKSGRKYLWKICCGRS